MKRTLLLTFALAILAGCTAPEEPLSVRMMRSEMQRCPDASQLDGLQDTLKWNYTPGLEMLSFLDVAAQYGDTAAVAYVCSWFDRIIDADGNVGGGYKMSNYTLDHVCPARTLLAVYEIDPQPKYLKALQNIRAQLDEQPRTPEGGFWHKMVYPEQMWLDGLYMAEPFYIRYAREFEDKVQKDSTISDIVLQFDLVADKTFDPSTGLYRHAWDSSREMFWCDPETGQSAHAWGRALGWYTMALVDVLDCIPSGTQARHKLLGILQYILSTLPKWCDVQTGMWYQVLDQPGREGNYVEATCSAMFTYALLKSVRCGYIDADRLDYALQTYENLVKTFVVENEDGTISLTQCCSVAGLGGKNNRSGDYQYYISEPVVDNDPKGVGPFIWASLEYEYLKNNIK